MICVLLLTLLGLYLCYWYLQQHYQMFERDAIPGPKPALLIGNLGEFSREDPLATFSLLTKKFGKVFGYYEGLTPSVVVSDPMLIEQILVKHFRQFDGRPHCWPFLHGSERYSLHTLNGPEWKQHRDVIASAFKTSSIRRMWPRLSAAACRYIKSLERKQKEHPDGFDIAIEDEAYSFESFTAAAFDIDPDSLSPEERKTLVLYVRAVQKSASPENVTSGLSRTFPSLAPFFKLFDWDHKRLSVDYFRCISKRLGEERVKIKDGEGAANMLQHLLTARTSNKANGNGAVRAPLTETQLQGLISSLFSGGLGTAAATLDFAVHCLALHPDRQDVLREEVMGVCSGDEELLSMDQIQGIEYLDMFIKEVLRHYSVAPGVARTCSEDCVVDGVQFRRGTVVRLMGSVQYRDPDVYPDPEKFTPDRFSKTEQQGRHPYSFIPFGNGPRMCVAKRLGLLQVKLALAELVRRFTISTCSWTQTPLPLAFRPFLCPRDGVFIRLEPRPQ